MQFIKNGPNIPESLLVAQEEGRVVFFCGAGISRPTLPDFGGLVLKLYKKLDVKPNAVQQVFLKKEQYDTAIGLLEADYPGGREAVRRDRAARMALVDRGGIGIHWDDIMYHLSEWLIRHLDVPKLIIWLAKNGGHLHLQLPKSTQWQVALPDLLPDLGLLLRDVLDLMRELGGADDRSDRSYIRQPSISEHPQNQGFSDWTILIELLRDSWVLLSRGAPEQARLVAEQWQQALYPLFKRFAFFAATQDAIIPPRLALEWLLADEGWWLWSVETQREAMRLLVVLCLRLGREDLDRLETAIIQGPPRSMFKDNLDPPKWMQVVDRDVWLRLSKIAGAGARLGADAQAMMEGFAKKYPQWRLAANERDEFPFWMGSGDEWRKFVATPRRRKELIVWLRENPGATDHWQEDDWKERCRTEFKTTAYSLYALTREDFWPVDRWREALQAWTGEELLQWSWQYMAPVLAEAPPEVMAKLVHSLSWWLEKQAESFEGNENLFFSLCRRILDLDFPDDEGDSNDPFTQAINHPAGQVAEILVRWWYRQEPKDNQLLPDQLEPFFTNLCDLQKNIYRYARLVFSKHTITLFRVDPEWTKKNLLLNFDWQVSSTEARFAWEGFLRSPRFYRPLFELIKPAFLDTANHYEDLGDLADHYAALLTIIALESQDIFKTSELKSATEALPRAGLQEAAQILVNTLESAGERKVEFWQNRILPYWKTVWPKSRTHLTPSLSATLARLCVVAQEEYPNAFDTLRHWLQPIQYPDFVVHLLEKGGLAKSFPQDTLSFLSVVVDTKTPHPPSDLGACLKSIKETEPSLGDDNCFSRLMEYWRQSGEN